VRVLEHYVQVCCNAKYGNYSNIYIIDENTLSLTLMFQEFDHVHTHLIQSHRICSLIYQPASADKEAYYCLISHYPCQLLWKSEEVEGWTLESSSISSVYNNQIDLISIYNNKPITLGKDVPIF
jgi:hypothetical protein